MPDDQEKKKKIDDLDPTPVISRLLVASESGKLKWEPTADRNAFVASVGGDTTFRIQLETRSTIDDWGSPDTYEAPRIDMLDAKGKLLWDIQMESNTHTEMWNLYRVARRIGNNLDERLANVVKVLDKL